MTAALRGSSAGQTSNVKRRRHVLSFGSSVFTVSGLQDCNRHGKNFNPIIRTVHIAGVKRGMVYGWDDEGNGKA